VDSPNLSYGYSALDKMNMYNDHDDDDDYTVHQEIWEDSVRWGHAHPAEWDQDELKNNVDLLAGIKA